jgi:hypothetical protein
MYIDDRRGKIIASFSADAEASTASMAADFAHGDMLESRNVDASILELQGRAEDVLDDWAELVAMGIQPHWLDIDELAGLVRIGVSRPSRDAEAALEQRYGYPVALVVPHLLS